MNLIEMRKVRKSYRQGGFLGSRTSVDVLRGVDLEIPPGRCLGLLGTSGCGKSTAGRLILGLEKPDGGGVYYKGHNIQTLNSEDKRRFRRNSQVVFQNSHGSVNPRFKAWTIVCEPLTYFGKTRKTEQREKAAMLLKTVGLSERDLDKLPHQFSGGELQRVCIARALALDPDFIVFDEAVSSLDMYNQSLVLELLSSLKKETGMTSLFISHDLRVLLKISDSLAIMDKGRISSLVKDPSDLEFSGGMFDPAFQELARSVLPSEPVPRPESMRMGYS
ncbi:MAG: ATP-binding cassette domain-containing protein [Thermovirgaceae bacterium]|jgi:nickel transport system ATP-binding protein|nr:ATP-binding cassette domain-containing protein [Synergistales bacterium]MDI9392791.1 ATP-binding cassette domain-containing protein [Synergistota bacterium]NLV66031.1 ATP-binding cassette domain-containing protein [Synergistaceae bacterium]